MPTIPPTPRHIPLYLLWTFATLQDALSLPEHVHILDCEECRDALRVCLMAETFDAVLKEVRRRRLGDQPSDKLAY